MSIKMRKLVEKEIYTAVIDVLLGAGFFLSIDNGDNGGYEYEVNRKRDRELLLQHMSLTDEDRLYVYEPFEAEPFAWVYFVYGNDGWDVISDYTTNLEQYIEQGPVNDVVKKYED